MGKFLLTLFFLAAIAAVVAIYGLPVLKERDPELYRTLTSLFGSPRYDIPVEDEKEEESVPEDGETVKPVVPSTEPTPAPKEDNETEEAKPEPPPAIPTFVEDPEEVSSAMASDPGMPWGVAVTNAPFYVFEKNRLRRCGLVPGGTVLETSSKKELPEGVAISCKFMKKGKWTERFFVMMEGDVFVFPNETYSRADPEQRRVVLDFCSTYARYEGLRHAQRLRLEEANGNPHKKAYEPLKAEYDRLVEECVRLGELEKKTLFENVPGVSRGDVLAKLNALRVKQKALEAKFFPVREAFAEWEQSHEGIEIVVKPTPETDALLERLHAMSPDVAAFAPELVRRVFP